MSFGKEIVENQCNKWSENPQGHLVGGKWISPFGLTLR